MDHGLWSCSSTPSPRCPFSVTICSWRNITLPTHPYPYRPGYNLVNPLASRRRHNPRLIHTRLHFLNPPPRIMQMTFIQILTLTLAIQNTAGCNHCETWSTSRAQMTTCDYSLPTYTNRKGVNHSNETEPKTQSGILGVPIISWSTMSNPNSKRKTLPNHQKISQLSTHLANLLEVV